MPSDFDHRRSLRPRARCRALTHNTLPVFNLNTGRSSHMMPRALSLAGTLCTSPLPFPPLSLCSIHCIAADSDSYKYPACGLAKRQANQPIFPLLLCVFLGNCGPFCLVFAFVRVSLSLVRPDPAYRHPPQPSANLYVPFTYYKLTLVFRLPPRHARLWQQE